MEMKIVISNVLPRTNNLQEQHWYNKEVKDLPNLY